MQTSLSELGCLHPRLALLLKRQPELDARSSSNNDDDDNDNDNSNSSSSNKICGHDDLLPLTFDAELKMLGQESHIRRD